MTFNRTIRTTKPAESVIVETSLEERSVIRKMVDDLISLRHKLKQARAEVRKLDGKEKAIKQSLLETAEETGETTFSGSRGEVVFTDSNSRSIDPKEYYDYLVQIGQESKFWDTVKVGVGDAERAFGADTLEEAGIIHHTRKQLGSMKITE